MLVWFSSDDVETLRAAARRNYVYMGCCRNSEFYVHYVVYYIDRVCFLVIKEWEGKRPSYLIRVYTMWDWNNDPIYSLFVSTFKEDYNTFISCNVSLGYVQFLVLYLRPFKIYLLDIRNWL